MTRSDRSRRGYRRPSHSSREEADPAPALPAVGSRARLRRPVERFPHFRVEAGATGTVTEATDGLIAMRMDAPVPGAEEWDNEVCWAPEDGEALLGPGAAGAEHVAAAFDVDAELTGAGPDGEVSRPPNRSGAGALGFKDPHRQRGSAAASTGELLIGGYHEGGSATLDGEFALMLVEREGLLYPCLAAFGEAAGALQRAIDAGLLDVLGYARSRDELSRRLLALGLADRSEEPLPGCGEDAARGRRPR